MRATLAKEELEQKASVSEDLRQKLATAELNFNAEKTELLEKLSGVSSQTADLAQAAVFHIASSNKKLEYVIKAVKGLYVGSAPEPEPDSQ